MSVILDEADRAGMLAHVPAMDLAYDGDCAQPIGVKLPTIAINLPQRADRWQTFKKRMDVIGLTKIVRLPAIYGAALPDAQIAAFLKAPASSVSGERLSHLSITKPAIGAFMSHLAVWRWVIERQLPRVLVFEDDAAPSPTFNPEGFRKVAAGLLPESGLLLLGCIVMDGLAEEPGGKALARVYYMNGSIAYLVTPEAALHMIRSLDPPRLHIDHQMSQLFIAKRNSFPVYQTVPNYFAADWGQGSDIDIPIKDESAASREFGKILTETRALLLAEGRPLLPPYGER